MDWATLISEFIIPVIGIVLTVFVIPLLKEKHMENLASSAVRAAEQCLGSGRGNDKYTFAESLLMDSGVSEKEIPRLIESSVYDMNKNK